MLRYAIIGFGGLGKVHMNNMLRLEQERPGQMKLCAICGASKEAFFQNVSLNFGTVDISKIDLTECGFYEDYKELIDKEKPDFVISATPTFMHEEVAVYALERGIHILSEKPMSLTVEGCQRMTAQAEKSSAKLMIGQSARFTAAAVRMKQFIDQGTYGKVRRMEFCRYSQTPLWTYNNWILDPEKSGGCVLDMHIHDVDLLNWFFGKPRAISSVGTNDKVELESVITRYDYDGMVVTGSADWSMPQTYPFTKQTIINFEKATVIYTPDKKLMVYTDEESHEEDIGPEDSHFAELKTFIEWILDGKDCSHITSSTSVTDSVRMALAEIQSLRTGETVKL
ncbi:MAG: Gfo/Idh/MocA family oxidoreductase [Ruminococcaceae bacterium]|nr:Gfo/Idh/MocA family oxidoreductase [Oscillospiraceae bacterium]